MDRAMMRVAVAVVTAGTLAGPVHAQSVPITVELTGRMQFQWNTTSVEDHDIGEPIASSTFETRRVRLGVNVAVGDWIRGFIEPEYALGNVQLRQAWMALDIDPALILRAGQVKKPF